MPSKHPYMQRLVRINPFVTRDGGGRARISAYLAGVCANAGADLFDKELNDNRKNAFAEE